MKEGEPYSSRALDRSRNRLLRLQLFRYVSVQPDKRAVRTEMDKPASPAPEQDSDEPLVWPVVVQLDERAPRSIASSPSLPSSTFLILILPGRGFRTASVFSPHGGH